MDKAYGWGVLPSIDCYFSYLHLWAKKAQTLAILFPEHISETYGGITYHLKKS